MNKLNELYNIAENNNIHVFCFDLPTSQSLSLMDYNGNCYIGIDPFSLNTYSDEIEHLAHELGHCMTGSFYNRHAVCDIIEKHEKRADKWAVKKLIPFDVFKAALENGHSEIWELAEYFDVSERLIIKAFELYQDTLRKFDKERFSPYC